MKDPERHLWPALTTGRFQCQRTPMIVPTYNYAHVLVHQRRCRVNPCKVSQIPVYGEPGVPVDMIKRMRRTTNAL